MERLKKKHILIVGIFFSLIGYCIYSYYAKLSWGSMQSVRAAASCIKLYIRENEGRFPTSEQDLINKGFVKIETYSNLKQRYSVRCHFRDIFARRRLNQVPPVKKTEVWWTIIPLSKLNIKYGTKIDDIEVTDHRLYDKNTQAQIFLIESPYTIGKRQEHESISFELYKEMHQLQREHQSINEEN